MANIIERYDKPFEYAAIVMNLIIAIQFLKLWYDPTFSDANKIFSMATLMAFEFIMIHSGVFMAVMPKRISLFLLVPFYGLFAFSFSKFINNNAILITYGLVILNRMRFAFSNVSPFIQYRAIQTSFRAATSYIVLIFICVFSNGFLGPLGLTQPFLKASGYFEQVSGSGLFVEKPHVAISFGFFYYCTLAVIEIVLLKKNPLKV